MQRESGTGIQKTLYLAVTAVFLSVLLLSLFQMPASMSMSGDSSGCPFMSHDEVLCSMNTLDHIYAWKSAFTSIAPSFTLLLLSLGAMVIVFVNIPNLLSRQRYRYLIIKRLLRERTYTFSYRPLQELFSNGILNPKLF